MIWFVDPGFLVSEVSLLSRMTTGVKKSVTVEPQLEETGERHLTEQFNPESLEHLHRYALALTLCEGKEVADIACGEGFGSNLLAQVSYRVTGVDISEEVVAHAQAKYRKPNLRFMSGAVSTIPLNTCSVDVVVSFETIEHHDQHEEMLAEVKRILRPDGILIMSTPDKLNYSDRTGYVNPYHVKELYLEQLRSLVGKHFNKTGVLFQKVTYGSMVTPENVGSGFTEFSGNFQEIVAAGALQTPITNICIASDGTMPSIGVSLFEGMRVIDDYVTQTQRLFMNSRSWRIGRFISWPLRKLMVR